MHREMLAMTIPIPEGALSLVEAVEWLANRQYGGSEFEAWPRLHKGLLTRRPPSYVLYKGRSYEADCAQFAVLLLIYCRERFCLLNFAPAAPHDREVTYYRSPMGSPRPIDF